MDKKEEKALKRTSYTVPSRKQVWARSKDVKKKVKNYQQMSRKGKQVISKGRWGAIHNSTKTAHMINFVIQSPFLSTYNP